jgi:hypothetical protein
MARRLRTDSGQNATLLIGDPMKYLSLLLLAVALAACDLGASSPSAEPLPSIGDASMAADHSMEAGMSMEASAEASSVTGAACDDAVTALDATTLAAMATLDDASDALDGTIAGCESVLAWESALGTAAPLLDLADADSFLSARCAANPALAGSPICDEVAM